MINLLPEQAKERLAEERFSRFLIVFGVLFSVIVSIGVFLLWIPWITVELQEREFEKQLAAAEQSPLLSRVAQIEKSLSSLNSTVEAYERNRGDILLVSRIIDAVLSHAGSGISLLSFSYSVSSGADRVSQFQIDGIARDRKTLISFSDTLDGDAMIENVQSPISNFLEETNIEFTLTFGVSPEPLRTDDAL